MVLRGLVTIWSLATLPTSRSPFSLIATTLGRMSAPRSLGTTRALLLRTYATHVLVVPRSMPRTMGFLDMPVGKTSARGLRAARNRAERGPRSGRELPLRTCVDHPLLVGRGRRRGQLFEEAAHAHD